jgi:hypothetical protein
VIDISIIDDFLNMGPKFDSTTLKPKDDLFKKFWRRGIEGNLNPIVSRKLMQISDKIIESLDLKIQPSDIVITGSITSYNWHALSDIDLHIHYEFEKINKDFKLVKRMLDQTRINWNKTHNIKIAGKEVELYFQDAYEPHKANGIWSLELEKWLAVPVKLDPDLNLKLIEKKAEGVAQCIEHLYEMFSDKKFKEAYQFSIKLKNKIVRMRRAGLEKGGIYSPENLAFKLLRNSGYLQKLSSLKIEAYDRMMSVDL